MIRWLALLALAAPAFADPAPMIGRLSHAGFKSTGHCTATLVAGGHVVTAAHCMPQVPSDIVTVALGYDRGETSHVIRAPGADYLRDVGRDLAVLCKASEAQGLPMAQTVPKIGASSQIAGYGAPRVHALQIRTCPISAKGGPAFAIGCASPSGTSGGPILIATAGKIALVGVASATTPTQTAAFAVTPDVIDGLCGG